MLKEVTVGAAIVLFLGGCGVNTTHSKEVVLKDESLKKKENKQNKNSNEEQYTINGLEKRVLQETAAIENEIVIEIATPHQNPQENTSTPTFIEESLVVQPLAETTTYTTEPYEQTLEVTAATGSNIRKEPDASYRSVTKVVQHEIVQAKEKVNVDGNEWYHVKVDEETTGWVSEKFVQEFVEPEEVFIDAPVISQLPELPRGCEVTSLAMLLSHAGEQVDKMTLAEQVKKDPTPYEVIEGQIYFGNPDTGFVGDMYSFETPGLGVYHGPIAELAKSYLGERIIDLSGQGFETIYEQLHKGIPVWVINTSEFRVLPDDYWETWVTPTGTIQITYKEHSVLVTGYDEEYIYFNDPLAVQKNRRVNKEDFIGGWEQIGSQAISYN